MVGVKSASARIPWVACGNASSPRSTRTVHVGPIPSNSTTTILPGMCPRYCWTISSLLSVLFESANQVPDQVDLELLRESRGKGDDTPGRRQSGHWPSGRHAPIPIIQ